MAVREFTIMMKVQGNKFGIAYWNSEKGREGNILMMLAVGPLLRFREHISVNRN